MGYEDLVDESSIPAGCRVFGQEKCLKQGIFKRQNDGGGGATLFEL